MSSGVFGTVKPANLNISQDVEILYTYMPSRGETDPNFQGFSTLDAEECLKPIVSNDDSTLTINGLYRLRLPLDVFNKKGIYTVYIRPKERKTTIVDVSVLAAYPDIKGVILNIGDNELNGLSDLTGYRLDFGNNKSRLIKSCNRCEPVIVNTGDGYPKATRYNLTDNSSNYVFCTVTPSTSPSFKPNAHPYIGEPGIEVSVVNTFFTPQILTIEMVEHDMDTLSYMLEGDQTNDRDNAIITTYNDKHEIYHQSDYYVLKDSLGAPRYNVRKRRTAIDPNQDYKNIID